MALKRKPLSTVGFLAAATLFAGLLAGCAPKGDVAVTPAAPEPAAKAGAPDAPAGRPVPTASPKKLDADVIKIGLVASQNGALKPWGDDSIKGAQLAVAEVNAAGGIGGKQVQLLIGDSASTPEQGKTAAERLVADGAVALLGEVASGITALMADVAFENNIPLVAIGATRTDITQKGSNIFRVCYTDDFQGPVMAKFAFEELNLRKVALMTDAKQPYSKGLSDSFRKKFVELGGEVVDEQFYESGQTNFTAQITALQAKSPDGIFLSGYFTEVGQIARQARQAGMSDVKLFGGDGWDSTELVSAGGDAIVGGFFCNHYNNLEDRPEVQSFLAKWRERFNGVPGTTMGALGYDAASLMMDAIGRSGLTDSAAVTKALEETTDFKGVSGAITLQGMGGNPPKRALVVEVTRDGQRFVKAYEPADLKPAAP